MVPSVAEPGTSPEVSDPGHKRTVADRRPFLALEMAAAPRRRPPEASDVDMTRIVLAALPAPLREAVWDVVRTQPDLVVTGDQRSEVDLLLDAPDADIVVVAVGDGETGVATVERVLDVSPGLAVLAVDWGVRRAWLCRREFTRELLPDQTLDELARTLRGLPRRLTETAAPRPAPQEDR